MESITTEKQDYFACDTALLQYIQVKKHISYSFFLDLKVHWNAKIDFHSKWSALLVYSTGVVILVL